MDFFWNFNSLCDDEDAGRGRGGLKPLPNTMISLLQMLVVHTKTTGLRVDDRVVESFWL